MATDLAKAGFNVTTVYTADATTDLSAYADDNMIVVGEAGETAASMTSALSDTSRHRIKTETTSTRFHTYLVGVNDYSLTQAIQRFYSEIVVNGKYQKPTASDTTLESGGTNRDPGIIYKDGTYYYYENQSRDFQYGILTSTDKLTWTSAGVAYKYDAGGENASYFYGFTSQEEMEAKGIPNAQYWAPEVHEYNGAYYMFATYRHKDNLNRGTAIFKADSPAGPFIPWSNGFVTPEDQDCIDGTLYVDADGTPYIVYVNEWTNRGANATEAKSRMDYVQLSADLSTTKGEHYTLFQADDPTWTDYGIVDGPWLYTCEDGTLLMIWSNKVDRNYAVGVAKSSNGKIDGTWTQVGDSPLFGKTDENIYCVLDGGHGQILEDADGRLYLVLHSINETEKDDEGNLSSSANNIANNSVITFIPIVEKDGMIYLDTIQ